MFVFSRTDPGLVLRWAARVCVFVTEVQENSEWTCWCFSFSDQTNKETLPATCLPWPVPCQLLSRNWIICQISILIQKPCLYQPYHFLWSRFVDIFKCTTCCVTCSALNQCIKKTHFYHKIITKTLDNNYLKCTEISKNLFPFGWEYTLYSLHRVFVQAVLWQCRAEQAILHVSCYTHRWEHTGLITDQ